MLRRLFPSPCPKAPSRAGCPLIPWRLSFALTNTDTLGWTRWPERDHNPLVAVDGDGVGFIPPYAQVVASSRKTGESTNRAPCTRSQQLGSHAQMFCSRPWCSSHPFSSCVPSCSAQSQETVPALPLPIWGLPRWPAKAPQKQDALGGKGLCSLRGPNPMSQEPATSASLF